MDGIEATRAVLRTVPGPPKILVVRTFENDEYVYEALRAGADGFLLKRARPAGIVHAVRLAAEGESPLFPASVRRLAAEYGDGRGDRAARDVLERARLTDREAEVLRLMARGCPTRRSPRGWSWGRRRSSRMRARCRRSSGRGTAPRR